MDLATHFRVIAQNWLRILVISLALAIVVFLVSSFRADEYQATETLSIRAGNTLNQTEQDAATFAAQVYAKYVGTASFLTAVVRDSKLKLSLSEAASRISASPVGDLGYLDVKATGPNRKDAETLARVAGGQLVSTIRSAGDQKIASIVNPLRIRIENLRNQASQLPAGSTDRLTLEAQINQLVQEQAQAFSTPVDEATLFGGALAGKHPIAPQPLRDAVLGFLVALVVVSELTVLAHFTGDRFCG